MAFQGKSSNDSLRDDFELDWSPSGDLDDGKHSSFEFTDFDAFETKKKKAPPPTANKPPTRQRSSNVTPPSVSFGDVSLGFELHTPIDPEPDPNWFDSASPPAQAIPPKKKALRALTKKLDLNDQNKLTRKNTSAPIRFPKKGELIGGYRIVSELGRGAFARVYHAEEVALGNRPVALKVSRPDGDEPRVLARFQHTNIVPIYAMHDDPESGLRLMSMPYFGGANLAQLLDAAAELQRDERQGRSLIDALDLVGKPCEVGHLASIRPSRTLMVDSATNGHANSIDPTVLRADPSQVRIPTPRAEATVESPRNRARSLFQRLPFFSHAAPETLACEPSEEASREIGPTQPNRIFMRGTTFVRAAVWIIARLAEGLEHAHSRGYLHRDLKPSNILITADGTPMLLDFNLAAHTFETGVDEGEKAKLGGTLPYMAPEHLDAFNLDGKTKPEMVDERSDIYALGLILFEMISGEHPFPMPPDSGDKHENLRQMIVERSKPALSLRAANPKVPWSLDAIVRKCMDPDPALRYRSAAQFADELNRFLNDQPLAHTREPSLREQAQKWARRHPKLSSAAGVGLISVTLVLGLGTTAFVLSGNLQRVLARLNLRVFESSFLDCQFLLNTTSGTSLTEHLEKGLIKAKELRNRFEVGTRRDWTNSRWLTSLPTDEQNEVKRQIAELILLEARARVSLAQMQDERAQREALNWAVLWLNEVEQIEPEKSHSLYLDRAKYEAALGDAPRATADFEKARATPPKTARDLYLTAASEMAEGRPDRAETLLNESLGLDPRRYWTWFALGMCHLDQKRYNEAATDFSVCSMIIPKFAWSYLNRGVALARANRLREAQTAYDRALEVSPGFNDALVLRGLVSLELGEAVKAEEDLSRAISNGRGDPLVRAGLAEAYAKQGRDSESREIFDFLVRNYAQDPRWRVARGMLELKSNVEEAKTDFQAALSIQPRDARAHLGLARCFRGRNDAEAIKHTDQALAIDPNLIDALEIRMLLRARSGNPEAANDARQLLLQPTERRIYNAACAFALLGEKTGEERYLGQAVKLLQRSIDAGFPKEQAQKDPDLKAIQGRW